MLVDPVSELSSVFATSIRVTESFKSHLVTEHLSSILYWGFVGCFVSRCSSERRC